MFLSLKALSAIGRLISSFTAAHNYTCQVVWYRCCCFPVSYFFPLQQAPWARVNPDRLNELYQSLIGWLLDGWIDWLIDWLIVGGMGGLVDWLMDGWMDGWIDWLIVGGIGWLIDWLLVWWMDGGIGWFVDWLIARLMNGWMAGWMDWRLIDR